MSDDDGGDDGDFPSVCKDLWMKPLPDIFAATWAGSLPAVEKFVDDSDGEAATARDHTQCGQDNSALHYAAARGFADIAEYLLGKRASANAKNAHGVNPLFLAVQSQHEDVARLLINSSDLSFVDRATNLTIGDLCTPPTSAGGDAADGGSDEEFGDSKNEPLRELLLEKASDFTATAEVDVVRVGATTVSLQWELPFAEGTTLPVTRSVLKVYDVTDNEEEAEEPCKQLRLATTTANATTSSGAYMHRAVVRNLKPRSAFAFSVTLHTALQQGQEGPRSRKVQLVREPGKVATMNCTESKKLDSVRLEWTPPTDNGGADVSGYQIQMQRASGSKEPSSSDMRWFFVRRLPAHILRVSIPLHEGTRHVYYFRVAAENKLGTGPWTSTMDEEEDEDEDEKKEEGRDAQRSSGGGDAESGDGDVTAEDANGAGSAAAPPSGGDRGNASDGGGGGGSDDQEAQQDVGKDDDVSKAFRLHDADGDGFLNKAEFQAWAEQVEPGAFDSVSYIDICDENGCDDLKERRPPGISSAVFRKLAREAARKRTNKAEDEAYAAANGGDEDGDGDDYDGYSDEEERDGGHSGNGAGDAAAARAQGEGEGDGGGEAGREGEGVAAATSPKMREKATEMFQQFDGDGDGFLTNAEYRAWAEDQGAMQFDGFSYSEVCDEHYADEDVGLSPETFTEVFKAFVMAKLQKLSGQLL